MVYEHGLPLHGLAGRVYWVGRGMPGYGLQLSELTLFDHIAY